MDDIKTRKLNAAVAVEALRACRDPYDSERFVYFAEETRSYWSVTFDALADLGSRLDGNEAVQALVISEWAEEDSTGIERGSGRKVERDVARARGGL